MESVMIAADSSRMIRKSGKSKHRQLGKDGQQ